MRGIKVEKLESRIASPNIPGRATRLIAVVHPEAGICCQRRIRLQPTALTNGERTKLTQYRIAVVSNTRGPTLSNQSVPAIQKTNPITKRRTISRTRIFASRGSRIRTSRYIHICTTWYMKGQDATKRNG